MFSYFVLKKKYGYAISILPLLGFLFRNISSSKKNIEILHTILWFHKNVQYVGDGYVFSWRQSCWERRIFLSQIGHHPSQIFNSGAEARGS
jgi:hypothetical protein